MSDLIERQAAIDAIEVKLKKLVEDSARDVNKLRDMITVKHVLKSIVALPKVKLETVVCEDCTHWINHDRRCGFWNHGVKRLDWCSYAERRTDEPDDIFE